MATIRFGNGYVRFGNGTTGLSAAQGADLADVGHLDRSASIRMVVQ